MKRFILFLLVCGFTLFAHDCYAQAVTSQELLNNTRQYDGKEVVYRGEVVGDIMARGDHAWLHVNDGTAAIGIWLPKTMLRNISFAGDYHHKGDVVEVSGTFHRSCLEHGGDLDIHASAIRKIVPGAPVTLSVSRKKVFLGIGVFMMTALLYAMGRWRASAIPTRR